MQNRELHLHRSVVSYLISLRDEGPAIRNAVFSLSANPIDVGRGEHTALEPGCYLWKVEGHLVTYEVVESKSRVMVTAIRPLPPQAEE